MQTADRKDAPKLQSKYETYTPLLETRSRIFSLNRADAGWEKPRRMIAPKRNPNKWCDFHDDHGHLTEECIQLKDNIEDLIRQGYLAKYLADHREEKKTKETPKARPQIQTKSNYRQYSDGKGPAVFLIHGGTKSTHQCKTHLRTLRHQVNFSVVADTLPEIPTMIFSAEDCVGVTYDHEDVLVVSIDIANHTVHRVLVEGGSSANILFRGAFDKLKLDPRQLAKVNFPVIGFNGSSVVPDGKITLPLTNERRQTARNNLTEFLVVDVPTVYNVIVGRPLIHKVKGITSTYYQMMLYVSDIRVPKKLRGNQASARQCNYNAVKTRNHQGDDPEDDPAEDENEQDLKKEPDGTKRKSA